MTHPSAPSWPTVALTLAPAYNTAIGEVVLSGLYEVEDADSDERGRSWFNVVSQTGQWYAVDTDALFEQVDPQTYGHNRAIERDEDLADEDYYRREYLEVHAGAWRTVRPEQLHEQQEEDEDEAAEPSALER